MNNTMNEINLEAMSMVSGGSMYSVDESVFGVQEFIEKCKTERANNLKNGSALDSNAALDYLYDQYRKHGLDDRLDEWGSSCSDPFRFC